MNPNVTVEAVSNVEVNSEEVDDDDDDDTSQDVQSNLWTVVFSNRGFHERTFIGALLKASSILGGADGRLDKEGLEVAVRGSGCETTRAKAAAAFKQLLSKAIRQAERAVMATIMAAAAAT